MRRSDVGKQRFDELTRALGTGTSRRAALAGIAAGGLASLARATGALAFRCRGLGQRCRSDADCCPRDNHLLCLKGRCAPCVDGTTFCPGSGQCVASCVGGRQLDPTSCLCACPPETVVCAGACCAGRCEDVTTPEGTVQECVTA
jgi:hypothetical protein